MKCDLLTHLQSYKRPLGFYNSYKFNVTCSLFNQMQIIQYKILNYRIRGDSFSFFSVNRTCQQGYELIGNHCYKIHTSPRLDWEDAWSDCLSQSGYLAIIDSYEKLQGIVPLLRLVQWPYIFHVGLIRDLGSWSWLDGTSVDSALFEAGYPQKESGETCIAFYGYYPVIINMPCDDLPGVACQSAQGEKNRNNGIEYIPLNGDYYMLVLFLGFYESG